MHPSRHWHRLLICMHHMISQFPSPGFTHWSPTPTPAPLPVLPIPLFALYLNDLSIVVKYSILDLYTNDAELHFSHSDLGVVEAHIVWFGYCDYGFVVLNCVWMLWNSILCLLAAIRELQVNIECFSWRYSSTVLGYFIDPTLSWSLHICNIVFRVRFRLSSIFCYWSLPPAIFCLLYFAFVMPLFVYCDTVWCPSYCC